MGKRFGNLKSNKKVKPGSFSSVTSLYTSGLYKIPLSLLRGCPLGLGLDLQNSSVQSLVTHQSIII